MKNTIPKYTILMKEIALIAILFLVALAYNIYSLVQINDDWKNGFSQLGTVIGLTIIFYVAIGLIRLSILFFQKSGKSYQDYDKPEDF